MTELNQPEQITELEARELTDRIRQALGQLDLIALQVKHAYNRRADLALGYASWDGYVEAEFGDLLKNLDRGHRKAIVGDMKAFGMSNRAIGSTLGVDRQTVRNDFREQVGSGSPPVPVVGLDGKTYAPATTPQTSSSAERRKSIALELIDLARRSKEKIAAYTRYGQDERFADFVPPLAFTNDLLEQRRELDAFIEQMLRKQRNGAAS